MIKIGITGNIACGKSTAFEILKAYDYSVIDCDDIIKELYSNIDFIIQVQKIFPQIISDKKINLKELSNRLFTDSDFKKKYEEFIFPKVKKEINNYFDKNMHNDKVFVIVPLLYEAKFETLFDKIIFISAEENIRKQRLISRGSLLSNMAEKVINAQRDEKEKISRSDYVIKNNGTLSEFRHAVNLTLKKL